MGHNQLSETIRIDINKTQSSSSVVAKTEEKQIQQSTLLSKLPLSYNNLTGPMDFITNLLNLSFSEFDKKGFVI